jgi:hypothetical protein
MFDLPLQMMMRPLFLLLLWTSFGASAQDVLLMTNGKFRNTKGKVLFYQGDWVIYQTAKQQEKERSFLERKGKSWEQFEEEEQARTATAKEKLAAKRKEMLDEIPKKMEELSVEDYEQWKNAQMLKLAEAEASISAGKVRRKKRRFTKMVSRDLVFAYYTSDSTETIVYDADTLGLLADGDAEVEWGVEDMRKYIRGRQDGRRHRVGFDAVMGATLGTFGAFFGTYWGASVPAGYIVATSITNTKVQLKATDLDRSITDHPAYLDGYEHSAKARKTMAFVQGAVAGLGFGFTLFQGVFRPEGVR